MAGEEGKKKGGREWGRIRKREGRRKEGRRKEGNKEKMGGGRKNQDRG